MSNDAACNTIEVALEYGIKQKIEASHISKTDKS